MARAPSPPTYADRLANEILTVLTTALGTAVRTFSEARAGPVADRFAAGDFAEAFRRAYLGAYGRPKCQPVVALVAEKCIEYAERERDPKLLDAILVNAPVLRNLGGFRHETLVRMAVKTGLPLDPERVIEIIRDMVNDGTDLAQEIYSRGNFPTREALVKLQGDNTNAPLARTYLEVYDIYRGSLDLQESLKKDREARSSKAAVVEGGL